VDGVVLVEPDPRVPREQRRGVLPQVCGDDIGGGRALAERRGAAGQGGTTPGPSTRRAFDATSLGVAPAATRRLSTASSSSVPALPPSPSLPAPSSTSISFHASNVAASPVSRWARTTSLVTVARTAPSALRNARSLRSVRTRATGTSAAPRT
jgi:hypothetical protein